MVELKTFQADFVTNKSTCLDQLGEEFMRTLEKRKAQLVDIVQLFDDIEKVCYVATFVCIQLKNFILKCSCRNSQVLLPSTRVSVPQAI